MRNRRVRGPDDSGNVLLLGNAESCSTGERYDARVPFSRFIFSLQGRRSGCATGDDPALYMAALPTSGLIHGKATATVALPATIRGTASGWTQARASVQR